MITHAGRVATLNRRRELNKDELQERLSMLLERRLLLHYAVERAGWTENRLQSASTLRNRIRLTLRALREVA